jgi:hypothetical protein
MKRVLLLNLDQPDVRKLIWRKYLDELDRQMVLLAHG